MKINTKNSIEAIKNTFPYPVINLITYPNVEVLNFLTQLVSHCRSRVIFVEKDYCYYDLDLRDIFISNHIYSNEWLTASVCHELAHHMQMNYYIDDPRTSFNRDWEFEREAVKLSYWIYKNFIPEELININYNSFRSYEKNSIGYKCLKQKWNNIRSEKRREKKEVK